MKTFSRLLLAACLAAGSAHAAGKPPIVLVHGFLGFDHATLGGNFRYWGGFNDIAQHLAANSGRDVFTAGVGPVSSNYDRAIELYYQIKGGCVDYGAEHTARNTIAVEQAKPAGKCWAADPSNNPDKYPLALYPQWDAAHPIHLVGHSQGGQTIRTLIQLLEKPGESDPHCVPQDELLKGGRCGWVISATTIATPHNGTTLRDIVVNWLPSASTLAGLAVQAMGTGGSGGNGFKFRLEQYGVGAAPSESVTSFFERTRNHPFWSLDNHDSAQWELSPDGARELNNWVKTSPNVYYFSISAHAARKDMTVLLQGMAGEWVLPSFGKPGMGSFQQTAPGRVPTDARWFANDGVVNTISMAGPEGSTIQPLNGQPVKGVWNQLDAMPGFDHFAVIGWGANSAKSLKMYDKLMAILSGLD
ncbi:hypothetical protein GM658_11835 [Pseudoduganella eburnea]|uniref:triacylglycerol lipase n=1 Tax=Massilia eburnea TaxID=1776165 RepID=A0A6L6QGT0_9BURK|nr:hypothetical protein [Massilia eburnea]MTW11284.1 hypothetical protein [Massilia eburnea]